MKWPWNKEEKAQQFETVLERIVSAQSGDSQYVTPESCVKSPTVQAIVTAVSRRISITPVHVYSTKIKDGREIKEKQPKHPVAKLLRKPNEWQSTVDYWQDLASSLVRHGKYFAFKGQGQTGPIRTLTPIKAGDVSVKQDPSTRAVTFQVGPEETPMRRWHYIRGPARDYLTGDSPVNNVKTAIGLEIACEEYGATFFNNGAIPLLFLKYATGTAGFKTVEAENKFINDFQSAFSGSNRNKSFLLPKGIEPQDVKIENDKAQFLETRKFNQTVIAGAWGVPPHLIGNLENGTYNNVEQQDKDFTLNVIMPYIKAIESAMERDLLTDADRNSGIVIRFNMDATLRADFKTRMEGYGLQIANGMITPNDANENEGRNPKDNPVADSLYISANLLKDGERATESATIDTNIESDEDSNE